MTKDTGTYHYETISFAEALLKEDYLELEGKFEKFVENGGLEKVEGNLEYKCRNDLRIGYITKVVESEDNSALYSRQRENLRKAFNFFTDQSAPNPAIVEAQFEKVFTYPCNPSEKI